jgi:AcrR family transcriptional regulator
MPSPTSVRERMVRAVLRIIARDGLAGLRNRSIATEAGVSLGSVTYHFATQEDLVRESLFTFAQEEAERFSGLARRCLQGASLTESRQAVDDGRAQVRAADLMTAFEMYLQAGRDPQVRGAVADCFLAYECFVEAILVTKTIVALALGRQLRARAAEDESEAEDLAETLTLLACALASADAAGGTPSEATPLLQQLLPR